MTATSGTATATATATGPSLAVLVRPSTHPSPLVHVELDADVPGAQLGTWKLAAGTPARIVHAAARDAHGPVIVAVKPHGTSGAMDLVLESTPTGAVHLEYDVLAGDDAPDDPLGLNVLDDRFRASGEKLVALPESIEAEPMAVTLKIDGEPLRADKAASSLGVGGVRRTRIAPRALRYATFVAGSMGVSVIDAPEGHDEGAWLGYTAFDPRPAVAELAQVRSAFAEMLKAQDLLPGPPWTYLFVSQSRPVGSFTTTPRFESVLLQVGPSEPWGAPLRLSMAQQLARRWVGDALRFTATPGHELELGWFHDGVARYLATRLLGHAGMIGPNEWADAIRGELSVLATSPYASADNAALAAAAAKDPVARATMMARGALYAARESVVLEQRTKGTRDLTLVLVDLLKEARNEKNDTTHPLAPSAWLDVLSKDDPDAAKSFDAMIKRGGPITLPAGALGACFRAGTGEYVAFDAGFDVEATKIDKDDKVIGVRANGPAAKAGLQDGDVLESMQAREDDASVPVKLVVSRGGKKLNLTYVPRGAHGRGQTWTRAKGVRDDQCGEPP